MIAEPPLARAVVRPKKVRLDASTACQLRCPSCPTATGAIGRTLGTGVLSFEHFQSFLDENPQVREIELSNWGEIFLNPRLLEIMAYAFDKNVALSAHNGVNLNTATDQVLEALVRYRFRSITCSIDGASEATYPVYRRSGRFENVIENIRSINAWKAVYRSRYPKLTWQFVAFDHNQHEIHTARALARDLNMSFHIKLSWNDLYTPEVFSPATDKELIRKESGLGVADRAEYHQAYGVSYLQRTSCIQLWRSPQISWDGRVLGCCVNYWGDYGNAFHDGLTATLNGERLSYARTMLLGEAPARNDIPCASCPHYEVMQRDNHWLSRREISGPSPTQRLAMWAARRWPRAMEPLLRGLMPSQVWL